jgi:hypothetical protein
MRFLNHRCRLSSLHGLDQPQKNAVIKGSFESWLVGFISELNIRSERDMVGGGDFDAIIAWMNRRFLATPSERIGSRARSGYGTGKKGCQAIVGGKNPI